MVGQLDDQERHGNKLVEQHNEEKATLFNIGKLLVIGHRTN